MDLNQREFAIEVLTLRHPLLDHAGAVLDINLLQQVLDGGPYTESAESEIIALGTSLGDLLGKALNMHWIRFSDEYGVDLALRYGQTSIVIFPRGIIVKRVKRGEEVDLQFIFEEVVREVQRMLASDDYQ